MQTDISFYTKKLFDLDLKDCTNQQIYTALLVMVKQLSQNKTCDGTKKKVYYISAEFLIGKLLSNNLINLDIYDTINEQLSAVDKSISLIEEIEPEPSLGNGGLGRLAACFLDSMASVGINGDGVGINYHFGLFKQAFVNKLQHETPDTWIAENSWLSSTDTTYTVSFGGFDVLAKMYNIAVTGYKSRTNTLHLFDIDTVDEKIVSNGITFDQTDIKKNLTLFLYPDDSTKQGRLLRVYQQYFMVSCAAQLIIDQAIAKGSNLLDLADYAAVQINDTHPSLIIPEFIRILTQKGVSFDNATEIVTNVCSYTNHTILAEALEKWPMEFLQQVVPVLVPIIKQLDAVVKQKYTNPKLHIIDEQNLVHMAHLDIHFTHSTNGVAYLHTEILKNEELKEFYNIYKEKFNNKTNGITFRRWLMHCNPSLTKFLQDTIGDDFKQNAECLTKLLEYKDDTKVLDSLIQIKQQNKQKLADYLYKTQGVKINTNAVFDIQIKRLHEYKRQQLNVLYLIDKYLQIKKGYVPSTPIVTIFGAKAAPAYTIAKDIIHLILCLQQIINNDPKVNKYLQVVMVENYNVSKAELLIPACDISEQISLASKEASGTGNMKFMLNGAVTLGTMDGANVEIAQLVSNENIYTFGKNSDEIISLYKNSGYCSKDYYLGNKRIKAAINFITSFKMLVTGNRKSLKRIKNELINKDWFMTLIDFDSYVATKDLVINDYADKYAFAKKALCNIANAGFFSSDRTILEYNKDIWHT